MTQQTWLGSDLVSEVLLSDIPDNETELYTRVGYLEDTRIPAIETEIEDARDGQVSLLAKQQAQDANIESISSEVVAARDGESTLLAKQQDQDANIESVSSEVVAARGSFDTLLAKQQDQDTQIALAQTIATTGFPEQAGKNNFLLQTNGILPEWVYSKKLLLMDYDSRNDIKEVLDGSNTCVIINGLGLFSFYEDSEEPEDDESCFSTATGRWLLEAAHWDLVDAWQLPDDAARDEFDEDQIEWNETQTARYLYGTATCAITTIATVTSTGFTGTVTGAAVGDRVYVNPPAMLGSTAADTGRLSYHAYVSATDTVTIYLCNASAATASVNSAVRTAWKIMVIKE